MSKLFREEAIKRRTRRLNGAVVLASPVSVRQFGILLALILLPLYADQLNARKFLGFPLGYFLACHGLVLIAIVTVFAHINRQDAIDHWHGAQEDL